MDKGMWPSSTFDPVLDLKSVALFLAVAETGSMTKAARRFGASQSAVSQSISRVEERLGAALFERAGRPLRLTAAGEALRRGGPALLDASGALHQAVLAANETEPAAIRLGLIDSFAATVGPALIRRLRARSARISVFSGISPTLWSDLQNQRLEFMVLTDPLTHMRGARRRKLMTEPFVLLLPKRLAVNIDVPELSELAQNHAFIRYSIRSHIGAQIEAHLEAQGISPGEAMEFDGTEALFAMISAGLGWAITTPLCLVHGRGHADDLVPLVLPGKQLRRDLYLVSAPGASTARTTQIFTEARDIVKALITEQVRPWLPWAAESMTVYD